MVIKKNNLGDHPNKFVSETGSGLRRMFHGVVNKETGEVDLVEDKPMNQYAYIQSFKDSVDINKIVERFQNGEIDILDQVQGVYADISNAPKDLLGAYNQIKEAEYGYNRLPIEIREKFGNNFNNYLKEFGTSDWLEKVGISKSKEEEVKEVIDSES